MKAVFVIDIGNDDIDSYEVCVRKTNRDTEIEWEKEVKLTSMPKKQNTDEIKSSFEYIFEAENLDDFQTRAASYLYGHIDGWNDCLKEIEK